MPDGAHVNAETRLHRISEEISGHVKNVVGYRAVDLGYQHAAEARRKKLHEIRDLATDLFDLVEEMDGEPVFVPDADQPYDAWKHGDYAL